MRLVFERAYWLLELANCVRAVIEQHLALLALRVRPLCVDQVVRLVGLAIFGFVFVLGALVQLLGHHPTFLC